ncbi:hypothetical protein CTAYLR_008171 [Chrysophaeum taylorii]|uniref:Uncharacterized protein n=1 Tax=Chrysophaeum taylorii TaxID=2483200 RepID=A0AAD7XIG1_9STRA|nr:hypothetical protein CTAYLR_008171 [Chrysophaeum taylorii]
MFVSKLKSTQFLVVASLFVVFTLIIAFVIEVNSEYQRSQWYILNLYFLILCGFTPFTWDPKTFFKGGISDNATDRGSQLLVGSSAFISWIFAKSITNSSKQGGRYGAVGGFAYAAWYFAFPAAACVCYQLRKKGYRSLPEAIHDKYGTTACLLFAGCVLYRLYNEVWSNSRVIADFFGRETRNVVADDGTTDTIDASDPWWAAAILSTALPLVYVFAGGMRSSLISDTAQAAVAIVFLVVVLAAIQAERSRNSNLRSWAKSQSRWSMFEFEVVPDRSMLSLKGGMDLFALGAIQGALSYPFFDPVLTDRCFLADPKTMARAVALGGFCAAWFITLFGLIGTHGNMLGQCIAADACSDNELKGANLGDVQTGAPAAVSKTLGTGVYTLVNIIMVTSGISTLDSTFTSVAKLCGPDLHGFLEVGKPMPIADATSKHVIIGRVAMIVVAIAGTLPLLDNPAELDATTVAGTIVAGLGGPIWMLALIPRAMMWKGRRPLAFVVPVLVCGVIGVCFRLSTAQDKHKELKYKAAARTIDFSYLDVGEGIYRRYLGINILLACVSFVGWFVFAFEWCWFSEEPAIPDDKNDDDKNDYEVKVKLVDAVPTSVLDNEPVKDEVTITAVDTQESKDIET